MIDDELAARIRRLFFVEHWKVGTVCTHLGVHHDAVRRVLGLTDRARPAPVVRSWQVDPYLPLVAETLQKYPALTATRLHAMIRDRGYGGGATQLRRAIIAHGLRPQRAAEAFATRVPLAGEEAQVDWATIGSLQVGHTRRPIYALVVVLPFSRDCWVGFYHDMKTTTLLEAHVEAFEALGGVPRRVLYDNMKTAVLERDGDAVRFHPALLGLADAYGFEPVACRPRRPVEKGSVERRIRDLRSSLLAGTAFTLRSQYAAAFAHWRSTVLHARVVERALGRTVAELASIERQHLRALPPAPFTAYPLIAARVGKQPWVTVDTNRYSVPPGFAGRTLSVMATHDAVCVLDGAAPVCTHVRSWDKHTDHELDAHRAALRDQRARSREHTGRSALISRCPEAGALLQQLVDRGELTANHTRALLQMLDQHGTDAVRAAITEAIACGTPRAASVRMLLDRQHPAHAVTPPIALPQHIAQRDTTIHTHQLGDYDACTTSSIHRRR